MSACVCVRVCEREKVWVWSGGISHLAVVSESLASEHVIACASVWSMSV